MQHTVLDFFIELVDLDTLLVRKQKELSDLTIQESTLHNKIQELQQQLHQKQVLVNDTRKRIHQLDLELKSIDEAEKEKKYKLGHASSPKEYFSLESEIALLIRKRSEYEEPYFQLWQQAEELERQLEESKVKIPQAIESLNLELSQTQKQKEYVKERIEKAKSDRVDYLKRVEPEFLQDYEHMLQRVPNPVVPIIKESCSACFHILSPQRLQLSKNATNLIKCQDCFRFLYYPKIKAE